MRANPGGAGASGGADSIMGFVLSFIFQLIAAIVVDIIIDMAAEGRPWKVKAYRKHRAFFRKIHSERLPPGVEPEQRMAQLLDELAPKSTPTPDATCRASGGTPRSFARLVALAPDTRRNDAPRCSRHSASGLAFVSLVHSPGNQRLCDIPLPVNRLLLLLCSLDALGQSLEDGFGVQSLPASGMVVSVIA